MGLGQIKNGVQQVITPRNGKNWCDTVNASPAPEQQYRVSLAIGKCNADGSGYTAYEKPVERRVELWAGDFRL